MRCFQMSQIRRFESACPLVKYCWTCHEKMDPLGLPFEMYNHAGLFEQAELNQPVDTSGEIIDSGDPSLMAKSRMPSR